MENEDNPDLVWSMLIGGVEVFGDWRLQVRDPSNTGKHNAFFVLETEQRHHVNDLFIRSESLAVVR